MHFTKICYNENIPIHVVILHSLFAICFIVFDLSFNDSNRCEEGIYEQENGFFLTR